MANAGNWRFPEPGQPWKPQSYYSQGRRAYVWGFWIFTAIATPLLISTVVLAVLAVLGAVPWRVVVIGILGATAAGIAVWLRTEDGTGPPAVYSSVPD